MSAAAEKKEPFLIILLVNMWRSFCLRSHTQVVGQNTPAVHLFLKPGQANLRARNHNCSRLDLVHVTALPPPSALVLVPDELSTSHF